MNKCISALSSMLSVFGLLGLNTSGAEEAISPAGVSDLSPAAPSDAGGLQEVVVTAQRRTESAQRAPIPVSAVSGDALRNAGITSPAELTSIVPSLQIADGNGPNSFFYLRGVGAVAGNAFSDSPIAFNFNGVYISRPSATDGFFYDLERVEVVNGPQGTLYGRNATGGAINVISKRPVLNELSADLNAEYGNYAQFRADGVLNAPLGSEVAMRLAAFRVQHRGYMDDGTDDQQDSGARLSFSAALDNLNILLVADYFHQGGHGNASTVIGNNVLPGVPFQFPGPNFGLQDRVGLASPRATAFLATAPDTLLGTTFFAFPGSSNDNHSAGVSATVDWTTPAGTLTIVPAFRSHHLDYITNTPGFVIDENSSDRQTSVEARLASSQEHALRYLLGVYYFDESIHVPGSNVYQQSQVAFQKEDNDTRSKAVFGSLTYAITEAVRFTAGVRYTKEDKEFSGTFQETSKICVNYTAFGPVCPAAQPLPYTLSAPLPPSFIPGPDGTITAFTGVDDTGANQKSASYGHTTWRGAVDWDIAEQNLLYASVETGFKAGGFFFSHDQGYFKPETIKAYTLGSKNRFLDNRLQLNIEAYYWKYTDQQFSHLGTDSTGSILFPTENIGDATMKGVEVSAQLHPFRGTLLGADIQYNDAVYNSFVYHTPNLNGGITNGTGCANAGVTAAFYVVNCSGQRPPNAPLWSLDADIQQTIFLGRAGTLTGEARVHFQTATLTGQEFLKVDVQPAYAIANFSLMYSPANGRFSVTGFVNNAFNRTVLGYSEVPPFAYFAVGDLRPPRTYGIRFGVHIG